MSKIRLNDPLVLLSVKFLGIGLELCRTKTKTDNLLLLEIEAIVWNWGKKWQFPL